MEEFWIYFVAIVFAGLLSLVLCLFSFFKLKNAPGSGYYTMVTLLSSIFTFSYAFELTSTTLNEITFWSGIEYLAMPFIPTFLLLMCFQYVGVQLRRRYIAILFAFPIFTVFTHHTNALHHLYYSSITLRNDTPFPVLGLQYGPFFYVHSFYLFVCLTLSIAILLLQLRKRLLQRFRLQILTMATGLFVPIVANYFYLNNLSPYGIDLGPVSMSLSFIFHALALFSFQMFNVLPVAREQVFESMIDGVLVLNENGNIVDYNQAVLSVMPLLKASAIGRPIQELLSDDEKLGEIICQGQECDYEGRLDTKKEHYHVRFSPLVNKKGLSIGNIITFVKITERVELEEKLIQLAIFDGLTQVYNRSYFMEQSSKIVDEILVNESSASLILFDLDHFKQINDTYGHETGDKVLSQVAKLVKDSLRPQDLLGRYGGEEFIILLPEMVEEDSYLFANTIRERISESFTSIDDLNISVTSSFGISTISAKKDDDSEPVKIAIREADKALYAAKRNGRNNVQKYNVDMLFS